jgi:hypothetical protein
MNLFAVVLKGPGDYESLATPPLYCRTDI